MLQHEIDKRSPGRRARLLLKYLMYPGTNWISRDKSKIVRMFLTGTPDRPIRTLDCGCGNAFFARRAIQRHARCVGITIHGWEKQNCEEMRAFLGLAEDQLELRLTSLEKLAAEPSLQDQFDQVLLLDVIEHIMDAPAALHRSMR